MILWFCGCDESPVGAEFGHSLVGCLKHDVEGLGAIDLWSDDLAAGIRLEEQVHLALICHHDDARHLALCLLLVWGQYSIVGIGDGRCWLVAA